MTEKEAILVSDLIKWTRQVQILVKETDLKEQAEMMRNRVNPNNPKFKGYKFWEGYLKALKDIRKHLQEEAKHK